MADVAKLPHYDISNEAWREYVYGDGSKIRFDSPSTLIVEKKDGGDRHRLILRDGPSAEVGVYVTPGWKAIRWQTPDGAHGIVF